MTTSQQQWRRGSQVLLLVAALALVLFLAAGSADAHSCSSGWKDCDHNSYNGCETNVYTDPYNCGYCGNVCKLHDYKYGETYCSNGKCYSRCKYGWKYNSHTKTCYKS